MKTSTRKYTETVTGWMMLFAGFTGFLWVTAAWQSAGILAAISFFTSWLALSVYFISLGRSR